MLPTRRRPLRRRVGNMGACPPPLRGHSAVLSPNAAMYLFGQTIELHNDFDFTGAWRHHVSMRPLSRSQSAATTALAGGTLELSESRNGAKSHTGGFWGAVHPLPCRPSPSRCRRFRFRTNLVLSSVFLPLLPVCRPFHAGGKRRVEPSATSWRAHGPPKGRTGPWLRRRLRRERRR